MQCLQKFVGPSDKSGENGSGPVKVRMVSDQMSGKYKYVRGNQRRKIVIKKHIIKLGRSIHFIF
jgi:hypothetical protein